jgi:hypothetical protein
VSSVPLVAAKGYVTRPYPDGIALVPVKKRIVEFDRAFVVNRVGLFVWEHLDGQHDRDALCAAVRERFAVPDGHDVGPDIDAFLEKLVARGMVGGA